MEHEVFPPGSRVQLRGGLGGYVLLVVNGGYVVEADWVFHSSSRPITSELFYLVKE